MASYYYLISSLPALKADSVMPFDYQTFLKMCDNSVSRGTYEKLRELSLDSDDGSMLKQWGTFYNRMMSNLCRQRNIRLGKADASEYEKDSLIDKAVDEALNAENPLEAEKILLACQFEFLDSLVSMHYFDEYVLFGYAIKLKLLERQSMFDHDLGKNEFSHLFEGIQKQILAI